MARRVGTEEELLDALEVVPRAIRQMLHKQCQGDWSRVSLDGPGSFTVHNRSVRAVRPAAVEAAPVRPTPPPPPSRRRERVVQRREPSAPVGIPCPAPGCGFSTPNPTDFAVHALEHAAAPPVVFHPAAPEPEPEPEPDWEAEGVGGHVLDLLREPAKPVVCGRCDGEGHSATDCPWPSRAAARRAQAPDTPLTAPRRPGKAASARPRRRVALAGLADALGLPAPAVTPEPATATVVRVDPADRLGQAPGQIKRVEAAAEVTVETFDEAAVERSAARLRDHYAEGMPLAFGYLEDVLALYGVDLSLVEAAVREPTRVEVRPESMKKGYPVLGFIKGDLKAIIGFREPAKPLCIAVYVEALLEHDTHRVSHVGGGGAKRSHGNPTNPGLLLKRLIQMGASYVREEAETKDTVSITYHGQDLGQISCAATTPRRTTETDWQRMQRKISAIDQREKKVGVR